MTEHFETKHIQQRCPVTSKAKMKHAMNTRTSFTVYPSPPPMKTHMLPFMLQPENKTKRLHLDSIPCSSMNRLLMCFCASFCIASCAPDESPKTGVRRAAAAGPLDRQDEKTAEGMALHKIRVQNWPKMAKGMPRDEVTRLMPMLRLPTVTNWGDGTINELRVGLAFSYKYNAYNMRYELESWDCFGKGTYPELAAKTPAVKNTNERQPKFEGVKLMNASPGSPLKMNKNFILSP